LPLAIDGSSAAASLPAAIYGERGTPPLTLRCYAFLSAYHPSPLLSHNVSAAPPGLPARAHGSGWFVSAWTLHGERRRKPGLNSVSVGDSIDLTLPLDRPTLCVGLSYLVSYEHMGSMAGSCLPPCACEPFELRALDKTRRVSVLRSHEFAVNSSRSDARLCSLRMVNVRSAGARSSATPQADFHLAGVQMWLPPLELASSASRACASAGINSDGVSE
jgi:hypothetical protein